MPKKRKLNSTNPKFQPKVKRDDKVLRKFIKEVKGVKIYTQSTHYSLSKINLLILRDTFTDRIYYW